MSTFFDENHPMFFELINKDSLLTSKSRQEFKFKCRKCGLIYDKAKYRINKTQETACSHCGKKPRWCGSDDCSICEKRFIYNCSYFEKAYKSGLQKDRKLYTKTNEAKVTFYCHLCDHVYTCRIFDFYYTTTTINGKQIRCFRKQVSGCNHCVRLKALCDKNTNCNVCSIKKGYNNTPVPTYFDKSHPLFHELVDQSLKLKFSSREEPDFKCTICGLIYTKIINNIKTTQKNSMSSSLSNKKIMWC